MKNYDDVLLQLTGHGLEVDSLQVGRMTRCKVDGGRERRGWYILHEMRLDSGDILLVGSYGIWQGADNGALKVELSNTETVLSTEQKAAIRKRIKEDKKRAEYARKEQASKAAKRSDNAWRAGSAEGHIDYFDKKQVQNFGGRFTEKGALMIPMTDANGQIHGLQFILDSKKHADRIKKTGRNKEYWPAGLIKKGHFHLIGSPQSVLLIAEGYATAASLHQATTLPVAIAFDANNILPVAEAMRKRYPSVKIIICADDDSLSRCSECKAPVNLHNGTSCATCGEPHKKKNAGIDVASLAAMQLGCKWIKPEFVDQDERFKQYCKNQGKLTDFNDVHMKDGLHLVLQQVDKALDDFNFRIALNPRGSTQQGGGDDTEKLVPIDTTAELLTRFSLIYGEGGIVFDRKFHKIIKLTDMRDACVSREIHRTWQESHDRDLVMMEEVGFDPSKQDKNITCNLFDKWPTTPQKGKCELLLELLDYMCMGCNDQGLTYDWILKWLAYPIQHPGAKMKSAVVIHGPQGTGKNLFFETVMSIYGQYGRTIDQSAIEDQFTDWISKKLFLIADEVIARSEKWHIKNKLKGIITGDWVRVNTKNKIAYDEKNHVNLVFLSNEHMPVVLEEDDRRYAVVWTPEKLSADFYKAVGTEIRDGGSEALHDYLLNLPIGDFNEHTKPPQTQAKKDLIDLSKDNVLRFYDDWMGGELEGIPIMPVLSSDIYELYKVWTAQQGVRATSMNQLVHALSKRQGMDKKLARYLDGTKQKQKRFLFPLQKTEPDDPAQSKSAWLGQCVAEFSAAVDKYKEF